MGPAEKNCQPDDSNQAYDALLIALDEAIAEGATRPSVDETPISAELAAQARDAQECLELLEEVRHARLNRSAQSATAVSPAASRGRIGRFEIERELGRGGYGVVFLAFDPKLRRQVALKVPRPEVLVSHELSQRFLREAQVAGSLAHPNVMTVYEVGEDGPLCYIAAAYCGGPTLAQWLKSRSAGVPARQAAALAAALADGVAGAHARGILHRDIKPSNVLLEDDPALRKRQDSAASEAGFVPKLTDFGLARLQDDPGDATRSGALLGTPAYMAPEQAAGRPDQIDCRTDVYALGAVLYELLTGARVYPGTSDADVLRRVAQGEPPSVRATRPEVPRDLEAICLKCLENRPADRYGSAALLAEDLRHFLSGNVTAARPMSAGRRGAKWARRRPALAGLIGVSVAAVLMIAGLTAWHVVRLSDAAEMADTLRAEAQASASESERQALAANKLVYASRMKLGYECLDQGDVRQVAKLLEPYRADGPLADLRGFEWFHLTRRLHGEKLTLLGHKGEVYAVAFAPGGQILATGAEDGLIKLWDANDGHELATIPAHTSCVNTLVFSENGHELVSGSCDHLIKIWDTHSRQLIGALEAHPNVVQSIAISPANGHRMASCGLDPVVRVWNMRTRQVVRTFDVREEPRASMPPGGAGKPSEAVYFVQWHLDGSTLFFGTYYAVVAWNVETNERQVYPHPALALAHSPTTCETYWSAPDFSIQKLGDDNSAPLRLMGHVARTQAMAISADGKWLASASGDCTVRLWDLERNQCAQVFTGHEGRVDSLSFSPQSATLASGSFDGTARVWDYAASDELALSTEMCVPQDCNTYSESVVIAPDFKHVGVRSRHDQLKVIQMVEAAEIGTLPLAAPPGTLRFAPDRPELFGAILRPAAGPETWDVAQWKSTGCMAPPAGQLRPIAPYGERQLIAANGRELCLMNSTTGAMMQRIGQLTLSHRQLPANLSQRASPDGRSFAIALDIGEPTWLFVDGDKPRQTTPGVLAVSNRAELLAVPNSSTTLSIIAEATGAQVGHLRHQVEVKDVAFSPDGRTIATCCGDDMIHLWNLATGQEMTRLPMRQGHAFKVQFSADGRKLGAVAFTAGDTEINQTYPATQTPPFHVLHGTAHLYVWRGADGR